jgi:hypothetical protein
MMLLGYPLGDIPESFLTLAAFTVLSVGGAAWLAWRVYRWPGARIPLEDGMARKPYVYAAALVMGVVGIASGTVAVQDAYWGIRGGWARAPGTIEAPGPQPGSAAQRGQQAADGQVVDSRPRIWGTVLQRSVSGTSPPVYHLIFTDVLRVPVGEDTYHAVREGQDVRLALGKDAVWRLDR